MAAKVRFQYIPPDSIDENTSNPRQSFDEERLDQLAESIKEKGVLVPITVFEKGDGAYTLLDGARRLRAAKRLNLPRVPSWVTTHPDPVENLEAMFHIHMERDDWTRPDTLQALKALIHESGVKDSKTLHSMTGLRQDVVEELQRILSQPAEYQKLIMDGTLPFIFFTELHARVIEPLKVHRPGLFKKFNEAGIAKLFVGRRKSGSLENMTQVLRQVNAVIRDAGKAGPQKRSPHDQILERMFSDPDYPIEEAYEDVTGATVEAEKFVRQCERFRARLTVFVAQELTAKEKGALRKSLRPLLSEIQAALRKVKA